MLQNNTPQLGLFLTTYLLKYLITIDSEQPPSGSSLAHGNGTGLPMCAEGGDLSYSPIRVASICVSSLHTVLTRSIGVRFSGIPSLSIYGTREIATAPYPRWTKAISPLSWRTLLVFAKWTS